jgi:CubicO group peptidase (beta-lactamase class C family)
MRNEMLILIAFAAVPCAAQRPTSPDWAAFDRYVAQAAHEWKVPGLAIAIVKDDSLVFAKGYGADEHTRFAIGSTTKAMTSAGLAMLVDEGKLHFDDKVTKYIPELQLADAYASHELTIRDLLTHRSGLGGTDMFWYEWEYPRAEVIRRLRYVEPTASFRSTWQYQNVMYSLAGTIIERVSGMPWESFVRQRIFSPLGMNETIPLVAEAKGKPNVAVPHVLANDSVRAIPMRSTDGVASAGSVYSSVNDMSKWMRFILDSGRVGSTRLIQAATFRELITPQIRAPMSEYPALQLAKPDFFSYGLGWFVQDYAGQQVWMHTGSIDGMCAIIGLMPNERLGVYVLENLDHAELRHALMYEAFDLYNGGPRRDWSAEVKALFDGMRTRPAAVQASSRTERPASAPLDRYVGTYADSAYGTVTVTLAEGKLHARVVTDPDKELEHADVDVFRTRGDPESVTQLVFLPNGTGGIGAVRVNGIAFGRVVSRR